MEHKIQSKIIDPNEGKKLEYQILLAKEKKMRKEIDAGPKASDKDHTAYAQKEKELEMMRKILEAKKNALDKTIPTMGVEEGRLRVGEMKERIEEKQEKRRVQDEANKKIDQKIVEKTAENIGAKQEKINDETYELVKGQLPDNVDDLHKNNIAPKSGEKTASVRTMEEVEREREKKAQKVINKTEVDYYRSPKKELSVDEVSEMENEARINIDFERTGERFTPETKIDRGNEMEKLEEEMAAARKDYLEMDYKKRSMTNKVQKYFGNKILGMNYDITEDKDVQFMRAHYENKLLDWKNAKLDSAKKDGVSNERLGQILQEILKETNVNLVDAHNQARAERQGGSVTGVIKKSWMNFYKKYEKLPLRYKIASGVAIGIGGFSAAALGLPSVGISVAGIALGKRIVLGGVAATGATLGMEKMAQKKREKNIEKEVGKFSKELEVLGMTAEEKEARINVFLEEAVNSVDNNLQKTITRNRINLGVGVMIGSFISTGAASFVLEKFGITGQGGKAGEWVGKMKEYFGKQDLAPMGGSTGGVPQSAIEAGKNLGKDAKEYLEKNDLNPYGSETVAGSAGLATQEVPTAKADIAEGAKISKEEVGSPRASKGKEYFEKLKEFQEEKPKANLSKEAVVSDLHNVEELPKNSVEKNVAGGANGVEDTQAKTAQSSAPAPEEMKTGKKIPSPREKIISAKPEVAEAPAVKSPEVVEVPGGKKLTVGQWEKGKMGGSFEGELKRYLVEEKKMNKTEAGKLAHRMRMDFQKEHPAPKGFSYHKIMPGAQIEISADGKVANFHDGAGSKWPEHGVKSEPKLAAVPKAEPASSAGEEPKPAPAPEESKLAVPKTEPASSAGEELKPAMATENIEKGKMEKELPSTKVHVSKIIEKDLVGRGMDEINAKSQADALASGYQESDNAFERAGVPENVEIRYEYGSDGKIVRVDGLYEKLNLLPGEDFRERTEKVLKNISLGSTEIWGKMKNLNAFTIKESGEINADVKKNIMALKDLFKNSEALGKLGENAEPKENETMLGWLSRVIKLSMTKRNPYEGSI